MNDYLINCIIDETTNEGWLLLDYFPFYLLFILVVTMKQCAFLLYGVIHNLSCLHTHIDDRKHSRLVLSWLMPLHLYFTLSFHVMTITIWVIHVIHLECHCIKISSNVVGSRVFFYVIRICWKYRKLINGNLKDMLMTLYCMLFNHKLLLRSKQNDIRQKNFNDWEFHWSIFIHYKTL